MEEISREIYDAVKAEVLADLEAKKLEKKRINLAADAVFAQARRKYMQRLAEKFADGKLTYEIHNKFNFATKIALESYGCKNARQAYLEGYAEDANKKAEQILELLLQE